jgi:hypothetical protein
MCRLDALRRADPPSKESYLLCKNNYETEEDARVQQRDVEPLMTKWMNDIIPLLPQNCLGSPLNLVAVVTWGVVSNLDWNSHYLHRSFRGLFLVHSCRCWDSTYIRPRTFHSRFLLFIVHLTLYSVYAPWGPAIPQTGFPQRGPGFEPRSVYVGFVVNKVALGQVFSEYFRFPCQLSFHRLLHIHNHLSSRAGTIGQLVADVTSELSLTSPTRN